MASIPDAPYEGRRDARNFRVIDFPYDKNAKHQEFQYMGPAMPARYFREAIAVLGSSVATTPQVQALGNLMILWVAASQFTTPSVNVR